MSLECVNDIKSGDGLAASVLGVSDSISDDVLKEDLKDSAGLLVDQATDALDSTPACQTADGRLGDALDVVAQHLPVALGTTLSESLSSFSASCRGWVGGVGLVYVLWVAVGRLRGARIDCESLPIHNKSLGGCGSLCCNSGDTKFPQAGRSWSRTALCGQLLTRHDIKCLVVVLKILSLVFLGLLDLSRFFGHFFH